MLNTLAGIIASSGGAAASTTSYESIATSTVGSGGASTITFSSIPSTYQHLQIRAIGKGDTGGGRDVFFRFNGDTGSNYNGHQIYGNGSSVVAQAKGTGTTGYIAYWSSDQFGPFVFDILDYSNTSKYKTTRSLNGHDENGSGFILFRSGLWMNTNAITSITISLDAFGFAQYSSFALYGIKG